MPCRTYVAVTALFDKAGGVMPSALVLKDAVYTVERVLECCRAVAVHAGGQGFRYTVRIRSRETYLFLDENERWFVEAKENVR